MSCWTPSMSVGVGMVRSLGDPPVFAGCRSSSSPVGVETAD
jgi:hypothetical protein